MIFLEQWKSRGQIYEQMYNVIVKKPYLNTQADGTSVLDSKHPYASVTNWCIEAKCGRSDVVHVSRSRRHSSEVS